MSRRGRAAALLVAPALALGAAGCIGGDDEPDPVQLPATVPETIESPEQGPTAPSGGTTAPGSPNPAKPDSPTNDVPPKPGSPEEQFERFCDENPGACG